MYSYSHDVIPPEPVVPIEISTSSNPDLRLQKIALIDSGSDISGLPPSVVDEFSLNPIREELVEGSTGRDIRPIYTVNILFHGTSFLNLSVMGLPYEDYIVIGRDILNSFHICLDGVNEVITIED
jgi:hypothetical protein